MADLTPNEGHLLMWLSEATYSQYGECYGPALDALIAKGLAEVHEGREHQSGFIAQGDGPMYRAVSVTKAGWAALEALAAHTTKEHR